MISKVKIERRLGDGETGRRGEGEMGRVEELRS